MPDFMTLNTDELLIHDGVNERCKLNGASVNLNFDDGARYSTLTTDENGNLGDAPMLMVQKNLKVKITITKQGYKTVALDAKISWNELGSIGTLGVKAVYMRKN